MLLVDTQNQPYAYPPEGSIPNQRSLEKPEQIRQAFNRAFTSKLLHYGPIGREVVLSIHEGRFDWRQDSWSRSLAADFYRMLNGVNALRAVNRKPPFYWGEGEEAILPGSTDTYPVSFDLEATGKQYTQREGIPTRRLREFLWQIANNSKLPVTGDRSLAKDDLWLLDAASSPYPKLHPENPENPYRIKDRIRHEAASVSADVLRQYYDLDANWRYGEHLVLHETELRFGSSTT